MSTSKKTVLILVNHEIVIYNFRLELVERLLADGHEVHISCPGGEKIDELVKLGCIHHDIKIARHGTNPVTDGKLILGYVKLLRQVKPDIVFSYTIKPNIYGGIACRLLNVPQVANITGLGTAVENPGLTQKITLALYRFAFKRIQRIFFQNTENRQFFIDHNLYCDKHGLLPGSGVNLERFAPLPYPQNDDVVHFVFISRIMKEKGIDQYLDAAQHFYSLRHCEKRSDEAIQECVFHVCGFCEAEYQGKLQELADKGIVKYHGLVRNIKEVLEYTHCTIHPSFYPEGLSNILLESCACARPIITTDRSGCREAVMDGVNGFVVKQKDSADLIEKIGKFLALTHEQKKKMGEAGRVKVEKEFDRQIVVDAYLKELEMV